MSVVELLSVLYNEVLRYNPQKPDWDERDYVVLSKGHSGPALYAALALHGFFDCGWLKTPGVDATTGSLGQGTSVAAGLGMALRLEKKEQKVYLIVGDGELNEGQCWEAFQFLAHHRLHEVIVIIDHNKRQLDGKLTEILNPFDLGKKMEAFGFRVLSADGQKEASILSALQSAGEVRDSAVCILMETKKAQGVPYYVDRDDNHAPKFDETAKRELDQVMEQLRLQIENGGN